MSDLNSMSMDDLVKFAEEGILPEGVVVEDNSSSSDDEFDMNALNMDDLLAMAEGKEPEKKGKGESEAEETVEEAADEDELMALLENTLSEDELGGGEEEQLELTKGIDKIKLRQLANRIEKMAPPKLFPPRKDEIYYFLSYMAGQSGKIRIDDAEAKCSFIGRALDKLDTFMVSEAAFSMDEQMALCDRFRENVAETVDESNQRDLVFQTFKFGWKQTLKGLQRNVGELAQAARQSSKPLWLVMKFYESLGVAYGLCRAQESFKKYENEIQTDMTKEQKRDIVNAFEAMVELAPYYGLKSIDFINRQQAYDALAALDISGIIKMLKERKR